MIKKNVKRNPNSKKYSSIFSAYLNHPYAAPSDTVTIEDAIAAIEQWDKNNHSNDLEYEHYFKLLSNLLNALQKIENLEDELGKSLINLNFKIMARIENNIFKKDCDDDPLMMGYFVNREKLDSICGKFLIAFIPKLSASVQDYLFAILLEKLRNHRDGSGDQSYYLPSWVYHRCINRLPSGPEKYIRLCEFYLKKIDDETFDHHCYLEFRDLLLNNTSAEYRYETLKSLIVRLETYSHERIQQKNLGYLFFIIFNKLVDLEKKQVFDEIISPMRNSSVIFLKQALAEILKNIEYNEDEVLAIICFLKEDANAEVARFGESALEDRLRNNASATSSENSDYDEQVYSEFLSDSESVSAAKIDSYLKRKENLRLEAKDFINSTTSANFRDKCIQGLNHNNELIRAYSWDRLEKHYTGVFASDKEKIAWVNIIFDGFRKDNFVYSEPDFTDYIFRDLAEEQVFIAPAIKNICKLIKADSNINMRERMDLLYRLLNKTASKKNKEDFVGDILSACNFALMDSTKSYSEKQTILEKLVFLCEFEQPYAEQVLMALISQVHTEQLSEYSCVLISEILSSEDDAFMSKYYLCFKNLYPIKYSVNMHGNFQSMTEQLIDSLVLKVAHSGNTDESKFPVIMLSWIINNSPEFEPYIKMLLNDYGITHLQVISAINFSKQNKKYELYAAVENLIESNFLEEALSLMDNHDTYTPMFFFYQAEIKLLQGFYSEAIELYTIFLKERPFFIRANIRIYECYLKMGMLDPAFKYKNKIQLMSPQLELARIGEQPDFLPANINMLPLENTIIDAENIVECYIKDVTLFIKQNQKKDTVIQALETKFNNLKNIFHLIFGQKLVDDFFLRQPAINWKIIADYPNQLPRVMHDVLMGILAETLTPASVKYYDVQDHQVQRMKSLDNHIKDCGICDFITNQQEPLSFLKDNFEVVTAYNFMKTNMFKDDFADACALGLSSDLSSAYTILVNALKLKHWMLVYDEVEIESSGSTCNTNEFMNKVMERKQAVIMFMPIIVKRDDKNNPTLDEIKYLINLAINKSLKKKVYLIFGAYDFLPIYLQSVNTVTKRHAPIAMFKQMMNYLCDFYQIEHPDRLAYYFDLFVNMEISRIRVNLMHNKTWTDEENVRLKEELNVLCGQENTFEAIIQSRVDEVSIMFESSSTKPFYSELDRHKLLNILKILDAYLFTDLPWFGSYLQLKDTKIPLKLKQVLQDEKFLNLIPTNCLELTEELPTFIISLNELIANIEYGLKWKGISDFQVLQTDSRVGNANQTTTASLSTKLTAFNNKLKIVETNTNPTSNVVAKATQFTYF